MKGSCDSGAGNSSTEFSTDSLDLTALLANLPYARTGVSTDGKASVSWSKEEDTALIEAYARAFDLDDDEDDWDAVTKSISYRSGGSRSKKACERRFQRLLVGKHKAVIDEDTLSPVVTGRFPDMLDYLVQQFRLDPKRVPLLLYTAAGKGTAGMVSRLIEKYGFDARDDSRDTTPLDVAAERGNLGAVKALIQHGAVPGLHTAMRAAYYGRLRIVRSLIDDYGVDPDGVNPDNGGTILRTCSCI